MSDAPKTQTEAGGYEGRIGRYGAALAGAFVAAAGVRPGQRVLDVGCGTGALTERLVDAVGAEHVVGIDPGADDIAVCAARCAGVQLALGEAEALPFSDASFDAALAQLVVGHLHDAERAVREMARVVRTGGVVAACVWDFVAGMTVLRAFWDAAGEVDASAAARFDQALTHPYSAPSELASLWDAAGLLDVRTGELVACAQYTDFEDLWQPMLVPDGAPGRFLATLREPSRDAVRERLFARLGRPDGAFELNARAWFVLGRVGDDGRRAEAA